MSRPVSTIDVAETVWDAWQLPSVSGLRHLPSSTMDGAWASSPTGDRHRIPVSEDRMRNRGVGELLSRAPARSVRDIAPLADVARLMARYSAEAVPVLDDLGRLVGIVTGSDLVRWWADEAAARP